MASPATAVGQGPDVDVPADPPGCCIVLGPAGPAPLAFGVLALVTGTGGQQAFVAAAGDLPVPAAFGSRYTRYVLWIFGGGAARFSITLGALAAQLGTVYAGGIGPVATGPLSEVAVSAEPPASTGITGPVVLTGSFAFCR